MPVAAQAREPADRDRLTDRIAVALIVLLSLGYAAAAVSFAARQSFWMDEVLAVWTARLPDVAAIWGALKQGSEFSPPLYHLLLHAIIGLGGDGLVALRLPSIVAVYGVGIAAFILARRRYPLPVACLALATCLTGILFDYAIQARQYACVAACFAFAVVLWDGSPGRRPSWIRAGAILLLLAAAIGLHFYAVLLAASVGLMECAWALRHRRIRWPILIAVALACLSILLWLPIMEAAGSYNRADAAAPAYYARPTLGRLGLAYARILSGDGLLLLSPLAILAVASAAGLTARRSGIRSAPGLGIVTAVLCAIPLLVFAFSALVTHTFNERYVIAAAPGFALLIAQGVGRHRHAGAIACALLGLSATAFLGIADEHMVLLRHAAQDLVRAAPTGLPIATGTGLRFFEIREEAGDDPADRLVFLTVPDLDRGPDPTNDHQVQRWARIRPDLPIRPAEAFLAANREFLLFSDPDSADMLPDYLRSRGFVGEVIGRRYKARLERVTCPPGATC